MRSIQLPLSLGRTLMWLALLGLAVIPWLACASCNNPLGKVGLYLQLAGSCLGIVLLIGEIAKLRVGQHLTKRIIALQTIGIVGGIGTFLMLTLLYVASGRKITFCPLCIGFWSCFGMVVLYQAFALNSRAITAAVAVVVITISASVFPYFQRFSGQLYQAVIPHLTFRGLAPGNSAPSVASIGPNGTYVFWSLCQSCRESTLDQVALLTKRNNASIVVPADSEAREQVRSLLPSAHVITLEETMYEEMYNISAKSWPYVLVLRDNIVVSGHFCTDVTKDSTHPDTRKGGNP